MRGGRYDWSSACGRGRLRAQARDHVIDALHGILELRFGEHPAAGSAVDSESLLLTIAA
jgi:hypothetical protein